MINVNEYFDGAVKSLGYQTNSGKATIGVMEAGAYEFSTGVAEIMTVVQGQMEVLLPEQTRPKVFANGESFEVPANSKFKVNIPYQTSYLCEYN